MIFQKLEHCIRRPSNQFGLALFVNYSCVPNNRAGSLNFSAKLIPSKLAYSGQARLLIF